VYHVTEPTTSAIHVEFEGWLGVIIPKARNHESKVYTLRPTSPSLSHSISFDTAYLLMIALAMLRTETAESTEVGGTNKAFPWEEHCHLNS